MGRLLLVLLLLLPPAGPALAAGAADSEAMNRIEFQVRAERDAVNDLSQATLVVEGENVDPARLAADINKTMAWALEQVRAADGVRARSGDYRTFPVYSQRRITHWRATQELTLESARSEQLNALVGKLQDRLQVRGMHFTVSPEQRRDIEEALTGEALDRFRQRAAAIAERLGAKGYDIVHLQVQDDGGIRPMPMARAMSLPEEVASEPGTSRLGVSVHAVIRLHH
jgi:predicted secreted protein